MQEWNSLQEREQIELAFQKLMNTLVTMIRHRSYTSDKTELNDLLNKVLAWKKKFQKQHNLTFLSREEVLEVYYKFDELKEKYLYDPSYGIEGELTDELVIWMWELMLLRKKQIEEWMETYE